MDDVAGTFDSASTTNDADRQSRRDRWKDALTRTKSKFKKERVVQDTTDAFTLNNDIDDFLAAGRKPAVTVTERPVADEFSTNDTSPRTSTSGSYNRQPSPRGISIPRLDVSQSQRWPNARQVVADPRSRSDDHLTPDFGARLNYGRSHSFNSALAKTRPKPRGLSVAFVNAPPTIIGEGGDEAEAPPREIGRARDRSRSLSPYVDRPSSSHDSQQNSRSPVRRKPVPPPSPPPPRTTIQNPEREDSIFQPKPFRRVQTGFAEEQNIQMPPAPQSLSMELQHALKLDERDTFKDPFANLRNQRGNFVPPPAYEDKEASITSPSTVRTSMTGYSQTNRHSLQSDHSSRSPNSLKSPSSLRSPNSPNLQQSQDTSYKPPPPKVRNFYAEMNQQSPLQSSPDEKQPIVYQIQGTIMQPHSRPQPPFQGQLRSSPTRGREVVAKPVQNVQQSAPEGWI